MLGVAYLSNLKSKETKEDEYMSGDEGSSCCGKRPRLFTAECEVAVVKTLDIEEVAKSGHEQFTLAANDSPCLGMDTSHNDGKKGQFYNGLL